MKTRTIILAFGAMAIAQALCRSGIAQEAKPKAASTVRIELPAETTMFRPGPGVEQAQTLCMSCHSADYIAVQPPMPRKFWEANVKKMKEKFGAPLPDDTSKLVDYLADTYGAK
jgi:sulfite dehydrogenase (cytochrome) subunit B